MTDMSSPDLTMFSLPALYALITDTSTVAEPLGPVVKDVTLPVITKSWRQKLDWRVPVFLQACVHSGFRGKGLLLTRGFFVTVLVTPGLATLGLIFGLTAGLTLVLEVGFTGFMTGFTAGLVFSGGFRVGLALMLGFSVGLGLGLGVGLGLGLNPGLGAVALGVGLAGLGLAEGLMMGLRGGGFSGIFTSGFLGCFGTGLEPGRGLGVGLAGLLGFTTALPGIEVV